VTYAPASPTTKGRRLIGRLHPTRAAAAVAALLVTSVALPRPVRAEPPRYVPEARAESHRYTPEVNYALHCQGCHLADGRATPDLVPPLDATLGRLAATRDGRAYLVRLPNVVSAQIDDAATAALMTWVVQRFGGASLPQDFAPYTADEIAAARRAPLVDLDAERRRVLALAGSGEPAR